jgi:hypothetical protein
VWLGLSQAAFRREVEALGGMAISKRTVENWANGVRPIPALLPALVRCLLERSSYQGDALGVPAGDGLAVTAD